MKKIQDERGRREALLLSWDEELLTGSLLVSELTVFLIRHADAAFCAEANLGALLAAYAAIEAHLRYEGFDDDPAGRGTLATMIDGSDLSPETRQCLHGIRRYRNRWVHIRDPRADGEALARAQDVEAELDAMTLRAMRLMREVLYMHQGTEPRC